MCACRWSTSSSSFLPRRSLTGLAAARFAVIDCKPELFIEPDLVKTHAELHPDATLEFCDYGYYTLQHAACKNLASLRLSSCCGAIQSSRNDANVLADAATVSFLAKGTMFYTWAHGQGTVQVGANVDDEVPWRVIALFVFANYWAAGVLKLVRAKSRSSSLPLFTSHGGCSWHSGHTHGLTTTRISKCHYIYCATICSTVSLCRR